MTTYNRDGSETDNLQTRIVGLAFQLAAANDRADSDALLYTRISDDDDATIERLRKTLEYYAAGPDGDLAREAIDGMEPNAAAPQSLLDRIAELDAENARLREAYDDLKTDEEWLRMMFDRVRAALEPKQ